MAGIMYCCTVYASMVACAEEPSRVRELTDEEALSALEDIMTESRTNYARLATLAAQYDIEDRFDVSEEKLNKLKYEVPAAPGPWQERDTGIVNVRFDAERECVFSEIDMTRSALCRDARGERMNHPLPVPVAQRAIVTPSHFYYFPYNSSYGDFREVPAIKGVVGHVAFRKPIEEAERAKHAAVVDPRDWFGYSDLFANELERIAEALKAEISGSAKKPPGAPDRVIRVRSVGEGENQQYVVLFSMWPSGATSSRTAGVVHFAVRAAKNVDYNCISVTVTRDDVDVEMVGWEYKEINDVFIPSKMSRVLMDPKTRLPTNQRVLVLKSCQVNDGISDEDISLPALGLTDGDRVMDYVDEVCYRYNGGQLDDGVSFDALPAGTDETGLPTPHARPRVLLIVNLLLVGVLLAFFIWRGALKR